MSMFSFPADMTTNELMKSMTAMTDWTRTADLQVSPLMVYPLGAAAAATAVGFGMAGQMTGMMMGAMQGALRSQSALLGAHPDLSWMVPTLAEDLPPYEDDEAQAEAAEAQPAADARSADIVALKPAAEDASAKDETRAARPAKAKAAPAGKTAGKPESSASPARDGAVAVVEKLKSDAEVAAAVASEPVPAAKPAKETRSKALEPEDFRRPAEMAKPATPDDLKLISGVGPKLEQVLNGLGVWTFAQIAAWQPEEVAWVDDYLQFTGRIDRDDWIAQAIELAKGGATAG